MKGIDGEAERERERERERETGHKRERWLDKMNEQKVGTADLAQGPETQHRHASQSLAQQSGRKDIFLLSQWGEKQKATTTSGTTQPVTNGLQSI